MSSNGLHIYGIRSEMKWCTVLEGNKMFIFLLLEVLPSVLIAETAIQSALISYILKQNSIQEKCNSSTGKINAFNQKQSFTDTIPIKYNSLY